MDIESNAIPHPDPDTTDRVSDQLSLSQVATEVDLCMEPVNKYLTQQEFALRVYSLKLAKVETTVHKLDSLLHCLTVKLADLETTLYNVDERLTRKLAENKVDNSYLQELTDRLYEIECKVDNPDLQELTDRLYEIECKVDNPDIADVVNELCDDYLRDNLSDAVQDIVGNATVEVQARIIT